MSHSRVVRRGSQQLPRCDFTQPTLSADVTSLSLVASAGAGQIGEWKSLHEVLNADESTTNSRRASEVSVSDDDCSRAPAISSGSTTCDVQWSGEEDDVVSLSSSAAIHSSIHLAQDAARKDKSTSPFGPLSADELTFVGKALESFRFCHSHVKDVDVAAARKSVC